MENRLRILHHNISVNLVPEHGALTATDTMFLAGGGSELLVYLGKGFALTEVRQGTRKLTADIIEEQRRVRRYRILGWDPTDLNVSLTWEGTVGEFELSKVCAISTHVVELSGWCAWFPTVEPSCEEEQFTYRLDIGLTPDWDLVTPGISGHGDLKRRSHDQQCPIEDIVICAAPRFDCYERDIGEEALRLYSAGIAPDIRTKLFADYEKSVKVMAKHFGRMLPGRGGVVVVTPRSPKGEGWGFERGDIWIAGDAFVHELVDNDWQPEYLPGPMSLSLHETIHAWIGLGLRFSQHWLSEALTQYLQVVLSEEMFPQPKLAESHFQWYVSRISKAIARDDRPISELTLADNPYDLWYLKGSWAFWDLEATVGRKALIDALAAVYRRHAAETIEEDVFVREMSGHLGRSLSRHFDHWFKERGFSPICR